MRHTLIDWIDARCRVWGQERRRLRAPIWPQSIAGRADEPIGYGGQREPVEVFTGDALLVAVAIRRALDAHRLSIKMHAVLHLHYDRRLSDRKVSLKCKDLGVSYERYYQLLGAAHRRLDAYWPTDMDRETGIRRDAAAKAMAEFYPLPTDLACVAT